MQANAESTVQIDNDQVRVTLWHFAPKAATGDHHHGMDYVVVPVVSGRLKLIGDDGKETFADLAAGKSYFRSSGVSHNVINDGEREMAFVEIELKA